MYINREKMIITLDAYASLMRILLFLLFISWLKSLKRRSNRSKIMWILLEVEHLEKIENSFK